MTEQKYKLKCMRCKEMQEHKLTLVRRKKGGKLMCLKCGFVSCYHNLNRLEPIENEN